MSNGEFEGIMASELVKRLNDRIKEYGDFPVTFGDWSPKEKKIIDLPVSGVSYMGDDAEMKEWYRLTWGFCLMGE